MKITYEITVDIPKIAEGTISEAIENNCHIAIWEYCNNQAELLRTIYNTRVDIKIEAGVIYE